MLFKDKSGWFVWSTQEEAEQFDLLLEAALKSVDCYNCCLYAIFSLDPWSDESTKYGAS